MSAIFHGKQQRMYDPVQSERLLALYIRRYRLYVLTNLSAYAFRYMVHLIDCYFYAGCKLRSKQLHPFGGQASEIHCTRACWLLLDLSNCHSNCSQKINSSSKRQLCIRSTSLLAKISYTAQSYTQSQILALFIILRGRKKKANDNHRQHIK